jgi:hypothetical protein
MYSFLKHQLLQSILFTVIVDGGFDGIFGQYGTVDLYGGKV